MGSAQDYAFGRAPWTAPAVEDLLPQLSHEEQTRLHNHLREHERVKRHRHPPRRSESERDFIVIRHVRYALHHYNARHPGGEFDAVKPLMESRASFRDQLWHHLNFWARCRRTGKIKRFFAEVHYRPPCSACSELPPPRPPVPGGAEKPPGCSHVSPPPVRSHLPGFVPVVEACTVIEEPLGRYWKSCAFCRGYLDILHPKGRGFVCGDDKDRMVQRIRPCRSQGLQMPFTCREGPESSNGGHKQEEED